MSKRICAMIDEDIHKKLLNIQASLIRKHSSSYSYSDAINHTLREKIWSAN